MRELKANLLRVGFDIVYPFSAHDYHQTNPALKLPVFSFESDLGLLIGFTRKFWDQYHLQLDKNLDHPFDHFVNQKLEKVLDSFKGPYKIIHYSDKNPDYFPFQKIAHLSGLAHLGPAHLLVHSEYGMWFSLRSILILDQRYEEEVKEDYAPCPSCSKPCEEALKKALKGSSWQKWVKVRMSCPEGKEWMYSDSQIGYHYTKDKSFLTSNNRSS